MRRAVRLVLVCVPRRAAAFRNRVRRLRLNSHFSRSDDARTTDAIERSGGQDSRPVHPRRSPLERSPSERITGDDLSRGRSRARIPEATTREVTIGGGEPGATSPEVVFSG